MKKFILTSMASLLLLLPCASITFAESAPIGSELAVIEGPPDLVQSLRESWAAGRPKAKKGVAKAKGKGKRVALAKKHREQESD
ncbi:MAG: hypothetical protein ACXWSD_13685 [Bdellovibrionota bacterium]